MESENRAFQESVSTYLGDRYTWIPAISQAHLKTAQNLLHLCVHTHTLTPSRKPLHLLIINQQIMGSI